VRKTLSNNKPLREKKEKTNAMRKKELAKKKDIIEVRGRRNNTNGT